MTKQWQSTPPAHCDICKKNIIGEFVDGKTLNKSPGKGSWAIMCTECYTLHGVGLAMGQGQRYRQHGEIWEKDAG